MIIEQWVPDSSCLVHKGELSESKFYKLDKVAIYSLIEIRMS